MLTIPRWHMAFIGGVSSLSLAPSKREASARFRFWWLSLMQKHVGRKKLLKGTEKESSGMGLGFSLLTKECFIKHEMVY